jgi:formylglycine-generating enzyme required for sulfatase activity
VAVKELPANKWGLYQMHGNVWQWCADALRDYSVDAVVDPGLHEAVDVKGLRVLRGGSWRSYAQHARSAYRAHYEPDRRFSLAGFRFVLRSSR